VKVIALLPIKNEAWVLEHTLACLSTFCDVIVVSDQHSTDASPEICRRFPKVVILGSPPAGEPDLPKQARWRLLDAARNYDGTNLLWWTDADELPAPRRAQAFLLRDRHRLAPGTAIELRFYNLWGCMGKYRQDLSVYGPYWKQTAIVDDRTVDFPRTDGLPPLHEPRIPGPNGLPVVRAEDVPVLHLQWAIWNRNQMKQAWYRCIEWLDRRASATEINSFYSITLPGWYVHTEPVPAEWLDGISLPHAGMDAEPSWHESEILEWFDRHGIEFFEPLEIWHVPALREEFRRRVGRNPKPDRSYMLPWPVRAQRLSRRVFHAVKRRIVPLP
jgi:glycosyltransferase involved in cell wall biosynthesis